MWIQQICILKWRVIFVNKTKLLLKIVSFYEGKVANNPVVLYNTSRCFLYKKQVIVLRWKTFTLAIHCTWQNSQLFIVQQGAKPFLQSGARECSRKIPTWWNSSSVRKTAESSISYRQFSCWKLFQAVEDTVLSKLWRMQICHKWFWIELSRLKSSAA